jgi:hypothetical protein
MTMLAPQDAMPARHAQADAAVAAGDDGHFAFKIEQVHWGPTFHVDRVSAICETVGNPTRTVGRPGRDANLNVA